MEDSYSEILPIIYVRKNKNLKFSLKNLLELNKEENDDFFEDETIGHEEEEEEIRHSQIRRLLIVGVAAVILVAALFGVVRYIVEHFHYRAYEVVAEKQGGDNGIAGYDVLQDKILKYSSDGISLVDQDLTTVWNQSVIYGNPVAVVRGAYAAVYDRNGTDISVFDRKGSIASFKSDLPIITARVSEKGNTALIVDDGTTSIVKYYSPQGSLLADISGGTSDLGQPLDADISEDGQYVAVTFLKAGDEGINAAVAVYRFNGETIENGDNLVFSEAFPGAVIPDVICGGKRIIALEETGFTIYRIGSEIKKENRVSFSENIVSCFYNTERIGFVFSGQGTAHRYRIEVYDFAGKEIFKKETDFIYDRISMEDDSVLLYNSQEMAVYTLKGNLRYSGVISDGGTGAVLRLSRNRYLISGNTRTRILQLKLLEGNREEG